MESGASKGVYKARQSVLIPINKMMNQSNHLLEAIMEQVILNEFLGPMQNNEY